MAVGSHQRRGPEACVVAFAGVAGPEEEEEVGIGGKLAGFTTCLLVEYSV